MAIPDLFVLLVLKVLSNWVIPMVFVFLVATSLLSPTTLTELPPHQTVISNVTTSSTPFQ